jgi:hypothetical protein
MIPVTHLLKSKQISLFDDMPLEVNITVPIATEHAQSNRYAAHFTAVVFTNSELACSNSVLSVILKGICKRR